MKGICTQVILLIAMFALIAMVQCNTDAIDTKAAAGHHKSANNYKFRLAYGSCFRHQLHYKDSLIMDRIVLDKPDSWLWLGDFAYLDIVKLFPTLSFHYNTLEVIKQKFEDSYNDPHYVKLREITKIYGIWDDHDSGINNSDKTNQLKEKVRQMFLDYMDEPQDSPRRTRKSGMYQSYYLDKEHQIKLILLDDRYERDALEDPDVAYDVRTILGEDQMIWLKQEVEESTAQFTLIAIGNQILPDDRPIIEVVFPKTKEYILSLHNPKTNIVLLSGDVHLSEIMEEPCASHIHGYPMREFTSSGLTHSVWDVLKSSSDTVTDFLYPETYNTYHDRYMRENYAIIDFDIDLADPQKSSFAVFIKDHGGKTRVYRKYRVARDFKKSQTPNYAEFKKCLAARGDPDGRMWRNMWNKATDPLHPACHLLVAALLTLIAVLLIIKKICKKLFCRRKRKPHQDAEKHNSSASTKKDSKNTKQKRD